MHSYDNYFQHHSYGVYLEENSAKQNREMETKFGKYISSSSKVLELGTGLGQFANFCVSKGVTQYTGIEVDHVVAEALGKKFANYTLLCVDALEFFEKTTETYDIIFLSHVFEHFSIEEGITLGRLISTHLTLGGMWINVMPNAGNISGCLARYNDITHKTLYTSNSFNQVVLEAGFDRSNIQHFNVRPRSFIKKILAYIIGKLIAIPYHTFELMSVITSKK